MGKVTFDEVLGRSDADCQVRWYAREGTFLAFNDDSAFEMTEDDLARLRAGDILAIENGGGYTVFVRLKTPVESGSTPPYNPS